MRKGQGAIMRIMESKRIKATRAKQNIEEIAQRIKLLEHLDCGEFITEIGEENPFYKTLIVNFALQSFLKDKKPVNTSFLKYLTNFQKFSMTSLLYAAYYFQNSTIISRGDIRTFIYLYFAFNVVSTKYLDDYTLWNKSFIPLWGVTPLQASQLEVFALKNIDYNMFIDKEKIEDMIKRMILSYSKSSSEC